MTAALLPETLYRDYREKVDRYVKSRVADRQDAEDLVEDVFVKACARLGQYDPDRAAPGTWLYAIARNAVVDYFRARGARGEHCGEEAVSYTHLDVYKRQRWNSAGRRCRRPSAVRKTPWAGAARATKRWSLPRWRICPAASADRSR